MRSAADRLCAVYALASAGDSEAYAWLLAFHGWAHHIDDFIDEPGRFAAEALDLCAQAVPIFSCNFYRAHAGALGPVLAVVAAKYRSSLSASGTLGEVLRVAGNDVVLAVAYLRGGTQLVNAVSDQLWPLVVETQLEVQHEGLSTDRAAA